MTTITQALSRDHDRIRAMLARALESSAIRERTYGQVADLIRAHALSEERTLYAALSRFDQIRPQIAVSQREHAQLDATLERLDQTAFDSLHFEPLLRQAVDELEAHLAVEETVVFDAARRLLPMRAQTQLARRYQSLMRHNNPCASCSYVHPAWRKALRKQNPKPALWQHMLGFGPAVYRGITRAFGG